MAQHIELFLVDGAWCAEHIPARPQIAEINGGSDVLETGLLVSTSAADAVRDMQALHPEAIITVRH